MGSNPVAQDSRKDALELKTRHAWSSVILTAGVTSKLLQYFRNYNFVVLKLVGQKMWTDAIRRFILIYYSYALMIKI